MNAAPIGRTAARWLRLITMLATVALVSACAAEPSEDPADRAAKQGAAAQQSPEAVAAGVEDEARAEAKGLAQRGHYGKAAAALAAAGLDAEATRVQRRGARTLLRGARAALAKGRYKTAKRLATDSRQLRKTSTARAVIRSANAGIAQAEAAARERRRLARIARDQRTCSSAEQRTVRDGADTPPGCADYAAEQAITAQDGGGGGDCDPNYAGACLKPDSPDYDCTGGSGDGPDYTGPVEVVGSDPYDLDADDDGLGCETS